LNWCALRAEGSEFGGPGAEIRSVLERGATRIAPFAGVAIDRIVREAFQLAGKSVREKKSLTEFDVKNWILKEFEAAGIWPRKGRISP